MRKLDRNGLSRYDRQRLAFIAGVKQAVQQYEGPLGHWYYRGAQTTRAYERGLAAGLEAMRDLLERNP